MKYRYYLLMCMLLVSGILFAGRLQDVQHQNDQLKLDNRTLKSRVDSLVVEVNRLNKANDELTRLLRAAYEQKKQDLTTVSEEKSKLQKMFDELSQRQADYDRQVRELNEKNESLKSQTDEYNAKIADLKSKQDLYEGIVRDMNKEQERYKSLMDHLRNELDSKSVTIQNLEGKLTLTFVNEVLFDSGSASISAQGRAILSDFAKGMIGNSDFRINVIGHTDNQAITGALSKTYPTNWELSTARALSVVRYLQEKCGMSPDTLYPTGRGFYSPIASNDTAEGRMKNRRVEIVILPIASKLEAKK